MAWENMINKRITTAQISAAIAEATGHADIQVHCNRQRHYCYYYSDDPNSVLNSFHEGTSVYIPRISDFTLEQWVADFQAMLTRAEMYQRTGSSHG